MDTLFIEITELEEGLDHKFRSLLSFKKENGVPRVAQCVSGVFVDKESKAFQLRNLLDMVGQKVTEIYL